MEVLDVTTYKSESKIQARSKVVQCARASLTPSYVPLTLGLCTTVFKDGNRSLRRFAVLFGKLPIQFRKRRNHRERMSIEPIPL